MKKRELNNRKLDSIGKALVTRSGVTASELDRLVANPRLFSLVNERIETTSQRSTAIPFSFIPFVRRHAFALSGAAILLIAVIGAASLLRPNKPAKFTAGSQVPAVKPDAAPPVFPPKETNEGKLSAGGALDQVKAETAIYRPPVNRRQNAESLQRPADDFYAISYAGDLAETAAGSRVIRVEMNRASLFAMGANIPLENGDEIVKADLLVGKDGVTRAVRLVD